jgi:hypothetical protein
MKTRPHKVTGGMVKAQPAKTENTDAVPAVLGTLVGDHKQILGMATWTISSASLILANLVPLAGAVFFKWSVFGILLSFWMENVAIGLFNILKMATANAGGVFNLLTKFFLIPFFAVHYAGFCFVHFMFLCAMFGNGQYFSSQEQATYASPANWPASLFGSLVDPSNVPPGILWAAAALVLSHAVSFFTNFLWDGERQRVSAKDLMMRPYGRVIIMHLTILAGGFLVFATGSKQYAIAVLVLLKIAVDFTAHHHERRKFKN